MIVEERQGWMTIAWALSCKQPLSVRESFVSRFLLSRNRAKRKHEGKDRRSRNLWEKRIISVASCSRKQLVVYIFYHLAIKAIKLKAIKAIKENWHVHLRPNPWPRCRRAEDSILLCSSRNATNVDITPLTHSTPREWSIVEDFATHTFAICFDGGQKILPCKLSKK